MKRPPAGGWRAALRVAFIVGAVVLGALALVSQRHQIAEALRQAHPVSVLLSALFVPLALHATMLAWRILLKDLGSSLPLHAAARIYYLSQLGKYLPGSVWPVLAQMELGREYAVPRPRSAVTLMVLFAVGVCSSLLVAAVTLPLVSLGVVTTYWWVWISVPVLLAGMQPRLLSWALSRAAVLLRREPPQGTISARGIWGAMGLCAVSWLCFGLHLGFLAKGLGASGASVWPLAIGAFSLAWAAGFIVIVVPAGAGIREAVIVVAFASVLPSGVALLVAILSRLLVTSGDLLLAGVAVAAHRYRRSVPLSTGVDRDMPE
ncbi:MAG TPA: lysylphosphatidylglycerol synthase domain-containing protein [Mycobacteriales bacterium]